MSFITELRRRNVFRVAIAYTITAWLIAQIAGLAADSFLAPDWVMKMIITVLVLGFPISLVLAWAFELTPAGLRRETGAESGASTTQATANKLDRTIIIALGAALAYIAYDKFVLDPRRDMALLDSAGRQSIEPLPVPEPVELLRQTAGQSIAVLSFVNMSDDASNEYFSDGLSEELLNLLVKIPELRVAARTSSFSFKGKNVKVSQIAEELNVTHVLEGSVRKAGNQIRVTAQLIKADDGFHLWSETFDRNLDDIFVVQDEIATAVVDALKINLLGAMPEPRKTDPEVYALYLQGQYFSNLRGNENLEKALVAYNEALAIDPEYAPAWFGIGFTYSLLTRWEDSLSFEQGKPLALEALNKALSIDENLASAWAGLAYYKRTWDWDWEGARAAIERAQQLEPNNASVIGTAASIATSFGQLDKAIELFERNVALDPLQLSSRRALALRYRAVGRHEDAIEALKKVKELNPQYPGIDLDLAAAHLFQGNPGLTLEVLETLTGDRRIPLFKAAALFSLGEEKESQEIINENRGTLGQEEAWRLTFINAWVGEIDLAFEWLEVAYEERQPNLAFILMNVSVMRGLASDPRFPVFLEKMDLREAWEAMPPEYGGPT